MKSCFVDAGWTSPHEFSTNVRNVDSNLAERFQQLYRIQRALVGISNNSLYRNLVTQNVPECKKYHDWSDLIKCTRALEKKWDEKRFDDATILSPTMFSDLLKI